MHYQSSDFILAKTMHQNIFTSAVFANIPNYAHIPLLDMHTEWLKLDIKFLNGPSITKINHQCRMIQEEIVNF